MRLGELLLKHRLIRSEDLEGALAAQRQYGGRLGTNLVQLGFIAVDLLARALSEQQGVPAVQKSHVAAIDKRVLGAFPAKIVTTHKAIPIAYGATKPPRLIAACADPAKVPLEELSFAAGCRVEAWVAPEVLIDECLEKYFGVPRPPSPYVDVSFAKRARPAPAPQASAAPAKPARPQVALTPPPPPPAAAAHHVRSLTPPPPPPHAPIRESIPHAAPIRESMPHAAPAPIRESAPNAPPASPHDRAPEPEPPAPLHAPEPTAPARNTIPGPGPARAAERVSDPDLAARASSPDLPPEEAWNLGEMQPEARPLSAPPDALRPFVDQPTAASMLEAAISKDEIGRVLEDWLRSTFGCGLVLILKNDMAVGWKGFFPDAEDLIEAVAVPLGKPSLFTKAYESHELTHGPPPPEGAKANGLLWKLLRCAPPAEVLVAPVVLGTRIVNFLYAHPEDGAALTEAQVNDARAVAKDAATAYARIIRKEHKKR